MPIIQSKYQSPKIFKNPHLQTILPYIFRGSPNLKYKRQRISTWDGDFIDLDWLFAHKDEYSKRGIVILCHGLEGNSRSGTVANLAKVLHKSHYDLVAMNYRSCSGETNKLHRTYHSGKTEDLEDVIQKVLKLKKHRKIYLVGVSIGGNLVLKYIGEKAHILNPHIKKAIALSAPIDLKSSALELEKPENLIYMKKFLQNLHLKMKEKHKIYPELVRIKNFEEIKSFKEFDDRFTAPLNGFESAEDYWQQASAINYLEAIKIPTLLLNSLDDSFLGPECFPNEIAKKHQYLHLETPEHGGHVGFIKFAERFYHEQRVLEFLGG